MLLEMIFLLPNLYSSLGYHYDTEQNPAEYFIKSLATVPGNETEITNRVSNIYQRFKDSEYAEEINDFIEEESKKKVTFTFV